MERPRFEIFRTTDGKCPFIEWHDSLPPKDARKFDAVVRRIEEHGIPISLKMQWVKKLDDEIWEIRSQVAGNIQRACYFQKVGAKYVITHGFTKKTQKTPPQEIERAKEIMKRYRKER